MKTTLFVIGTIGLLILLVKEFKKKNKKKVLVLRSLGEVFSNGKMRDLSRYYVDTSWNLYSTNPNTWEVNPAKQRDMLLCSNDSVDKQGNIVNSLRDAKGIKVTIRRKDIMPNGITKQVIVDQTTPRHFKVTKVIA